LQYLGWYFLSEMNIREGKYDVAYGMLNNSIIQLEKYGKASDFLMLLFRYNMFKVMMHTAQSDKAQILLNQSYYLRQKYNINFEFDIDPEHYISQYSFSTVDGEKIAPVEEPEIVEDIPEESEE